MPKVGKNIYKRKDGRWEGRYVKEHVNGRAKYGSVYAASYTEVKAKLDAKKRGNAKKISSDKAGNISSVSRDWLDDISVTLKESSVFKYGNILRCYILPVFGNMKLSDVTNDKMMDFVKELRTNGGDKKQGLSASTVSEVITVMNALRTYALKHNYAVSFSSGCVSIRQEKNDIRVFSMTEEKKVIDYLTEHMNPVALGVMTCLYTGIRLGELCALTWDEIDLDESIMRIKKTMQRLPTGNNEGPKTEVRIFEAKTAHSMRLIPLPQPLKKLLLQYHKPGTFLLTGDSKHYVEPRCMENYFKRIMENCNITDANFHATRHSFATRCVEVGFDIKTLSEILGHANVSITMNRYVHPSMELKTTNMNKLSVLFK